MNAPRSTIRPRTADELRRTIEWAVNDGEALEVLGRGGKRAMGHPVNARTRLELSGISSVVDYQPEELTLTVGAGAKVSDVEALLAQRSQMLAFEPPDYAALLGGEPSDGTLGAALACNLAGPRRLSAGAARDHFIGFQGVNGRGERFKSGGKMVKNVTGYDLSKLMAGSFGTLAALDEVTVRALPMPEKTRTLLVAGLTDAHAVAAMCAAMGGPNDVTGAAHLPAALAARSSVDLVRRLGGAVTALRIEGVGPSVDARLAALREAYGVLGHLEELHTTNSRALWAEVRDVRALASLGMADIGAAPAEEPARLTARSRAPAAATAPAAAPDPLAAQPLIWKLSCPPAAGAAVAAGIRDRLPGVAAQFDWSGGLVWLALPQAEDAHAPLVRAALAACGGHATLIRAPFSLRAARRLRSTFRRDGRKVEEVDLKAAVFQPQPPALVELTRRIKASFDPRGILNPGRLG